MSCITGAITLVSVGAQLSVSNAAIQIDASAETLNCIQAECELVGDRIDANISTYNAIEMFATQICTVKVAAYLKVDRDTLWATPEVISRFQVLSNVDWTIN